MPENMLASARERFVLESLDAIKLGIQTVHACDNNCRCTVAVFLDVVPVAPCGVSSLPVQGVTSA